MRSIPVSFDDGEVRAALTVRSANGYIATKRAFLYQAALAEAVEEPTMAIMRRFTYPDYVAASEGTITLGDKTYTVESAREPLPFDIFLRDLPAKFLETWGNAVYEANPQ